jgi:aminopeptidase N
VIDKWFAIQAAAPRPDALARAQRLRGHGDFELRNPNRVRALAAAFAMRNPIAFHGPGGGGYKFVAGLARDVDALNPTLAGRLLTSFESWRRFDTQRQGHAKSELEILAALPNLSKNAREMVERTLA